MKRIILSIAFIITGKICFLQTQAITPLQVGNMFPNMIIGTLLNQPSKKITFRDLKGKLVIFDFWNKGCSSCILAMPKLDSLQKKFGDKIQIVLITTDSDEDVNKLFSKIKTPKPDLPMIVNDKKLSSMFPHRTVPHHVWVDAKGVIQYITMGTNATSENIQAVLQGNHPKLYFKKEQANFTDLGSIWFQDNGHQIENLKSYSFILNKIDNDSGYYGTYSDSASGRNGVRILNMPIAILYQFAFGKGVHLNPFLDYYKDRVFLEVKDSAKISFPTNDDYNNGMVYEKLYSYESGFPSSMSDRLFEIMQQDLERFFPYKGIIEKRNGVDVLIIRDK